MIASPSIALPELDKGQVQVSIQFRRVEVKEEERFYKVRKGDTLYEIGRRYGVSLEELRQLNGLKGGDYLQPGQELKIPPS